MDVNAQLSSNFEPVKFDRLHLTDEQLSRSPSPIPSPRDMKHDLHRFKKANTIEVRSLHDEEMEVFCLRWAPDSRFLAMGCGDGSVRVFNAAGRLSYAMDAKYKHHFPTTCVRFRPTMHNTKSKNVLLVGNADGTLTHWHMASQKVMYTIQEQDNQIYAVDYSSNGQYFVTAGRDCKVRVYEETTKTLLHTMTTGSSKAVAGHSNRVYAAKYKPDDENIVLTGGWDNTVQIWDTRIGKSVRSIYGPHICGDALDMDAQGRVLTGSWRPENALQLWDFNSGELLENITWSHSQHRLPEMLYAAQFSPNSDMIAAGGSGTNEGRVFYNGDNGWEVSDRVVIGPESGVFCCDFSNNGRKLAFGGGDKDVTVMETRSL